MNDGSETGNEVKDLRVIPLIEFISLQLERIKIIHVDTPKHCEEWNQKISLF